MERRIAAELEELPLPYRFDVTTYDRITYHPFKQHIDECAMVLYSR